MERGKRRVPEHRLHIIEGADDQRMLVGPRQAGWLAEKGLIELVQYQQTSAATGVNTYRATEGHTAQQLNELTLSEIELLECDFCPPSVQAAARIHVRPGFTIDLQALGRPALGRDVFVCAECAQLVRSNAKLELLDRIVEAYVKVGLSYGNLPHQTRSVVGPQMGGFIRAVFANRQGPPEELQ